MQGWKLFNHALRMVIGNWRDVLRIFLVPGLMVVAALTALFLLLAPSEEGDPNLGILFLFLFAGIMVFFVVWTVVAWHRFVLLEETPTGWIPPVNKERMLSYFGTALLLWFLAVVVMVLVALFAFLVQAMNAAALLLVIALPLILFLAVLWLRASIVLPAAAVGKPLKISDALEETVGAGWSILLLIVLIGGLQTGLELLTNGVATVNAPIAGVFSIVLSVFLGVLNVSILTTLYGHFVEGRSVD